MIVREKYILVDVSEVDNFWIKLNGDSGTGKSTIAKRVTFQLNGLDQTLDHTANDILCKYEDQLKVIVEANKGKSAIYVSNKISVNRYFDINTNFLKEFSDLLDIKFFNNYFSEGESQRFKLLEAIMTSPGLLIMDECLSGLPEKYENDILIFLKENFLSMNCLYISHRLNEKVDELFDLKIDLI